MFRQYEADFAGRKITIETGKMAKQAHGSCTVDTATPLCCDRVPRGQRLGRIDFPLTVNYAEMTYAAGKIPGGFFREDPAKEVLGSRLIGGHWYFSQRLLSRNAGNACASVEQETIRSWPPIGASVALGISDIPFAAP